MRWRNVWLAQRTTLCKIDAKITRSDRKTLFHSWWEPRGYLLAYASEELATDLADWSRSFVRSFVPSRIAARFFPFFHGEFSLLQCRAAGLFILGLRIAAQWSLEQINASKLFLSWKIFYVDSIATLTNNNSSSSSSSLLLLLISYQRNKLI